MIFVCLGTKRFPFNRLLKEIDRLVENKMLNDEIVAQIGQSTYTPKHYKYKRFMDPDEYDKYVNNADLIITHGGTGAIVKALKAGKQTIAVPRLEKYGEHSDDHQLQIVNFFSNSKYIYKVDVINNLIDVIRLIRRKPIQKKFVSSGRIIPIIEEFIEKNI